MGKLSFILFIYRNISVRGEEGGHDYSWHSRRRAPEGNAAAVLASLRRLALGKGALIVPE